MTEAPATPESATPESLFRALADLGIETVTHTHPPLKTVEDSKALRGDLPGGHCKNLFLKDKKGQLWLVVTLEDRPVDMKDLKQRIGSAHLSFGRAELLAEVLGVAPGAVTPFALINDRAGQVNVVLDADMMALDLLNYHPLVNTMTVAIRPGDLRAFIRWTGHAAAEIALE